MDLKICVPDPHISGDTVVGCMIFTIAIGFFIAGSYILIDGAQYGILPIIAGLSIIGFGIFFMYMGMVVMDIYIFKWCDHWGIEK